MRAEVFFNYKNEDVKDYLNITRNILQQIIKNKNRLKVLLSKKNNPSEPDLAKHLKDNIRIIDSINEIVKPELSFRFLYDINPPESSEQLINEAAIGKTQCLAEVGIYLLTNENFSESFRIDLIEHTNITGFLSDQPLEHLYVNEKKINLYLNEYFRNYRFINSRYLPTQEVDLHRKLFDFHVNIHDFVKSNLTKKLLFEKELSLFEHNVEKFHCLINNNIVQKRIDELKNLKKEIEEFYPSGYFIFGSAKNFV